MRALILFLSAFCLHADLVQAQVLAPAEVKDENARSLQQKYFLELKTAANNVKRHAFPYHFYFSRVLDISEGEQQSSDQRAIQFDRFQGKLILKITGNYFASYSADSMEREQRARQTFNDVMIPILRAAVPQFHASDVPDAYALEISHHIRKKVLGVVTEKMENVVLVVPKKSADDLVAAGDVAHQNAALLNASAFVDGKPLEFWPSEDSGAAARDDSAVTVFPQPVPRPDISGPAPVSDVAPARSSPTLEQLQEHYRPELERMVRELDSQAHFVTYAPPAFIEFHGRRYLQLSLTTTLSGRPAGSRYRLAALSFDEQIAHLLRPVLAYVKNAQDFDGIDFSATSRAGGSESMPAVEYLFPLKDLKSYSDYDCTGQELLDAGFVLINGERVGLNLQTAEN